MEIKDEFSGVPSAIKKLLKNIDVDNVSVNIGTVQYDFDKSGHCTGGRNNVKPITEKLTNKEKLAGGVPLMLNLEKAMSFLETFKTELLTHWRENNPSQGVNSKKT